MWQVGRGEETAGPVEREVERGWDGEGDAVRGEEEKLSREDGKLRAVRRLRRKKSSESANESRSKSDGRGRRRNGRQAHRFFSSSPPLASARSQLRRPGREFSMKVMKSGGQ